MLGTIFFFTVLSFAQDLSLCANLTDSDHCRWTMLCSKDPTNPNKIIPADCPPHYLEKPSPPPTLSVPVPVPVTVQPSPQKEKSALETLYYIDVPESEQEKILAERARRQAERAVAEESAAPAKEKQTEPTKPAQP